MEIKQKNKHVICELRSSEAIQICVLCFSGLLRHFIPRNDEHTQKPYFHLISKTKQP
jgi:hypothetical protein